MPVEALLPGKPELEVLNHNQFEAEVIATNAENSTQLSGTDYSYDMMKGGMEDLLGDEEGADSARKSGEQCQVHDSDEENDDGDEKETQQQQVTELMLQVAALESQLTMLESRSRLQESLEEQYKSKIDYLGDELDRARDSVDDALKRNDELRDEIDSVNKANVDMKRILDALNINIDEQLRMLEGEKNLNKMLQQQADDLKGESELLRNENGQQNFCEMVQMELLVKAEDVDAIERDAMNYRFDVTDVARERIESLVAQLDEFFAHVVQMLTNKAPFCTPTLESTRLNLLTDAAALQSRTMLAAELLTDD